MSALRNKANLKQQSLLQFNLNVLPKPGIAMPSLGQCSACAAELNFLFAIHTLLSTSSVKKEENTSFQNANCKKERENTCKDNHTPCEK